MSRALAAGALLVALTPRPHDFTASEAQRAFRSRTGLPLVRFAAASTPEVTSLRTRPHNTRRFGEFQLFVLKPSRVRHLRRERVALGRDRRLLRLAPGAHPNRPARPRRRRLLRMAEGEAAARDSVAQSEAGRRHLPRLAAVREEVGLPSVASYSCRIGVNVVFMAAFGIPITAFTIFLIASSHMLSQIFTVTPGGVGQTQALDIATLRGHADPGDIAAFSITQDSIVTLWNVVLGLIVVAWAFGFGQVREMLPTRKKGKASVAQPEAQAPASESESPIRSGCPGLTAS